MADQFPPRDFAYENHGIDRRSVKRPSLVDKAKSVWNKTGLDLQSIMLMVK